MKEESQVLWDLKELLVQEDYLEDQVHKEHLVRKVLKEFQDHRDLQVQLDRWVHPEMPVIEDYSVLWEI